MNITLSVDARIVVIPVAIDEYDTPPKDDPEGRVAFQSLPRIRNDVSLLRRLFASEPYRQAGFQMLDAITGSAGQIVDELSGVSQVLRTHGQPLYALLFWSGHGRAWPNMPRLATRDCFESMTPGDGLAPNDVINKLANSKVKALGFLCDVCQAGAAGAGVIEVAARQLGAAPTLFRGLSALFGAYPFENAEDGVFVETLERLLRDGPTADALEALAGEGRSGFNPFNQLLTLQEIAEPLAAEMEVLRRGRPAVSTPLGTHIGSAPGLFPNPTYRRNAPAMNAGEARKRLRTTDVTAHFLPKARGLEPGEPGWFFSGRRPLTKEIVDWMQGAGPAREHNLFMLTGDGGTGKSAIIGRFVTLSDEQYRGIARREGWDEAGDAAAGTVPPIDGIDAALHLRKLTAIQAAQALAEMLQIEPPPAGASVTAFVKSAPATVEGGERPFRIALDALDESDEPADIATQLIRPLAAKGWRILVASRTAAAARGVRSFPELLGPAYQRNLDQEATTEREISEYVQRRLLTTDGSPYQGAPGVASSIADTVGERARGKYLYARIATAALLRRPAARGLRDVENLLGYDLNDTLTREFAELDAAFEQEFDGMTTGGTTLFAALVWAEGDGLPLRDDLWPVVATAITEKQQTFKQEHALWLLREGGRFIVESGDGEQAVYRLYHESLNEHFRARREYRDAQVPVALALDAAAITAADWEIANPYLLRHLAAHLAALSDETRLRRLLFDYGWMKTKLLRLGIGAVLDDFARTRSKDRALASLERALSTSAHVLAWDPAELPAQLTGRLMGDSSQELVDLLVEAARISTYPWFRPLTASLATERSLRWLRPVEGSTLDRVAFSAGGNWGAHLTARGDVALWDLDRWKRRAELFAAGPGFHYALALSRDARVCVVSNSDGSIVRWDARDDTVRELRGQEDLVDLLAISADGIRALSADQNGGLVAWDFSTGGHKLWKLKHTKRTVAMEFGSEGESAVVARADGSVYLVSWGAMRPRLLFKLSARPMAIAWTADNRSLFVAGNDGRVQKYSFKSPAAPTLLVTIGENPSRLAITPDGHHLAIGTGRGTVLVWNIHEGHRTAHYEHAHTHEVEALTFCGQSGRLISADLLHLKEWSLAGGEPSLEAEVRSAGGGVVVTQDGSRAATVLESGELAVFHVHTGSLECRLSPAPCPEPREPTSGYVKRKTVRAASAPRVLSWIGTRLSVWDLDARAGIGTRQARDLSGAALTPDGRGVVYGDGDDVLYWKPDTGAFVLLGSHDKEVRDVAISPDGQLVITAAGDRTAAVWDLGSRKSSRGDAQLARLWPDARDKPAKVAFAGESDAIVATGDGTLFAFDPRHSKEELDRLGTHGFSVRDAMVTKDGLAVTGSYQGLKLWDVPGRRCIADLGKVAGNVQQLSERGDRLLILTTDGVLKLVSLPDALVVASFQADKQLIACAADDELQWFAAHDETGLMHFFHLENSPS